MYPYVQSQSNLAKLERPNALCAYTPLIKFELFLVLPSIVFLLQSHHQK